MKKPITTKAITMTVLNPRADVYRARSSQTKMQATATSGFQFAARNLAVRWFFGGHTHAHGVGAAENEAITVTDIGHGQFRATLKRSALV